mgnify:FL=1|jgi:hypothetical protein
MGQIANQMALELFFKIKERIKEKRSKNKPIKTMVQRNRQLTVCRCQKVKTVYRGGDGMNKLYDLLKYIIYASFYVIVIKTGMDFYEYKRFPKLYESYSSPWYTETLLYIAASLFVIVVCFVLRVILGRKMKKR